MHETTAVFLGIIIGVFLILICCVILYSHHSLSKRIEKFKEIERKAYAKAKETLIKSKI